MNLSALSDEDLLALKAGDLTKLSDKGLLHLKDQAPSPVAAAPAEPPSATQQFVTGIRNSPVAQTAMGLVRGATSIGATLQHHLNPWDTKEQDQERRASIDDFFKDNSDPSSVAFQSGKLGAEVAGTAGIGGVAAAPLKWLAAAAPKLAPFIAPVAEAIQTGGMRAGPAVPGAVGTMTNLATRAAGGAVTGASSAALVNPDDAGAGAAIGAAIPVVGKVAGAAGDAAAGLVKPFFKRGQESIVGETFRKFSTNPAARANLQAAQEVVPGSAPTAVMASGDEGLANLSRTMQSASPQYAAELSARQSAQNAARTSAIEQVAGNTGKLAAAKEARDMATAALRESALDAAGQVPATPVLSSLDSMLRNPNNAGRIAQQALSSVRDQVAKNAETGAIDSRALYAIRKDINDVLGGKLQGEAGNLRHASSQLIAVKDMIDNAIEQAGRRAQPVTGTALVPGGANITRPGAAPTPSGPRTSWKQYLDEYSKQSVPINQMELLDDVMKRIQTGAVDASGNLVLSAAKLNNLMKNEGQAWMKKLAPEQIDLIRRLAADLNASQLATTAGKAVGSNTVQNLASTSLLQSTLGNRIGGSTPATAILGQVLRLPYGRANQQITDRLGAALLDPQEAARLMQDPQAQSSIARLFDQSGARELTYRTAPLAVGQR